MSTQITIDTDEYVSLLETKIAYLNYISELDTEWDYSSQIEKTLTDIKRLEQE